MASIERSIQEYIDGKKELQKFILKIIKKSKMKDEYFQNLINFLNTHQYKGNKAEIKHFLHMILIIASYHHREQYFYEKIEKILTISSNFYKPIFSNVELFTIFQQSKPIILFLLKNKIISIDQIIFQYLMQFFEIKENENYYYFYPELISIIKSGTIDSINDGNYKINLNEDIEKFEFNRQTYESESILCSIIRGDLIEDFVQYVNKTNISLSSQIKRSFFETNPLFIEKEPTIIEYAFFFGSIRIIKYLEYNKVKLTSSLWIYAIHSNNPEVIEILTEKKIQIDNRILSESIRCHHNNISHYIYNNYFEDIRNISELNEECISCIYSSDNYEFFTYDIDSFYYLVKNEYYELANFYLELKKKEIESYIIENKSNDKLLFKKLFERNRLDVIWFILMKMTNIPANCFECIKMTKIAIPPSIKSIGINSFNGCSLLETISIPSSVTSIEGYAFNNCSKLIDITIPSSVKSIGEYVFSGCMSLKQITIPSSVTTIKNFAFDRCYSLKQVTFQIPSFLSEIGKGAFDKCIALSSISIPTSIISMGDFAFRGCSSLTSMLIPSSVSSIGKDFLNDCNKLNKVTIIQCNEKRIQCFQDNFLIYRWNPSHEFYDNLVWVKKDIKTAIIPSFIKMIRYSAFYKCSLLTSISIPSSVTSIGSFTFFNCSSLTQILIASSVKSIGSDAFASCSSLKQIVIPSSVKTIGDEIFASCTSLCKVTFEVPSSLTSIGICSFINCQSLTEISIPSSVRSIGLDAFQNCSSLIQVSIPSSINSNNLGIPPSAKIIII